MNACKYSSPRHRPVSVEIARQSIVRRPCRGYSLLELLAVVAILGVLATVVVYRMNQSSADARSNACYVNRGEIELQAQLWHRHHDSWPATDLGDLGDDAEYFPDGLPVCPVDGTPYTFNQSTQKVIGHNH